MPPFSAFIEHFFAAHLLPCISVPAWTLCRTRDALCSLPILSTLSSQHPERFWTSTRRRRILKCSDCTRGHSLKRALSRPQTSAAGTLRLLLYSVTCVALCARPDPDDVIPDCAGWDRTRAPPTPAAGRPRSDSPFSRELRSRPRAGMRAAARLCTVPARLQPCSPPSEGQDSGDVVVANARSPSS